MTDPGFDDNCFIGSLKRTSILFNFIHLTGNKVMTVKTITDNKYIIKDQGIRSFSQSRKLTGNKIGISPIFAKLAEEGRDNFYNYLDWLGFSQDPDILILTSSHHYYFENEDLKTIKTVLNLKQLNDIKRIGDFLCTIHDIVPLKCYFIGCFTDNKNQNGMFSHSGKARHQMKGKGSGAEIGVETLTSFRNMLNNIINPGTNRYITEKTVRSLFNTIGFKILDLTEFKGLTYFCIQKVRSSAE
jgi:hypothetical protein